MAQPVENLGRGGLNTDLPPMIVPQNTFTDVYNVRFDDESVQTITGETTYKTVSIVPDFGVHWPRPDQGYNIFGKNGYFVRLDAAGNSSSMLSSNDTQYASSDWQSTYFNGGFAIVINNGKSTPLYCLYNDPSAGSTFQPLPNWNYYSGLTVTAKVIRSIGYSLVAANLSITEGSTVTYAPGTVRVSVQAPTGGIPQTWEPGLTTDTADEFELSSTSPVLDMAELRGNMFIYSSDSINILTIGATTRVSPYSSSYGILNTDCVIEFDGKHFVVDKNDIYIHNGSGAIESVADWRIKKYFFNNLNRNYTQLVKVTKHKFYKEIWVSFPKGSSTVCNETLIYNYKNNTWTKRQTPSLTYSFTGPENISNTFNYSKEVVYITTNTSQTLVTDNNYLMWNGSALASYTSYIEKVHMNTGDVTGSIVINSLFPIFDKVPSEASITIRLDGQNNYTDVPDLSVDSTRNTFVFEPDNARAQGYKVDPRLNGRLISYRITSTDYWRLALIYVDAKQADRR